MTLEEKVKQASVIQVREEIKVDEMIQIQCFFSMSSVDKLLNFFAMYCRELLKKDSGHGCIVSLGSLHIHPVAILFSSPQTGD